MMNYANKENLNRELIALMLKLARRDNSFDEREFNYIAQVSRALNLPFEEIRDIQLNLDEFDFNPPSEEAERMTILYHLLFCMKSDGIVKPEEINLVKHLGFRLGVRPELTDDLICTVKKYEKSKLPPDLLLNSLRKYMN